MLQALFYIESEQSAMLKVLHEATVNFDELSPFTRLQSLQLSQPEKVVYNIEMSTKLSGRNCACAAVPKSFRLRTGPWTVAKAHDRLAVSNLRCVYWPPNELIQMTVGWGSIKDYGFDVKLRNQSCSDMIRKRKHPLSIVIAHGSSCFSVGMLLLK